MLLNHYEIGVGTTDELSLRVGVATHTKVIFNTPKNEERYSCRKDLTGLELV